MDKRAKLTKLLLKYKKDSKEDEGMPFADEKVDLSKQKDNRTTFRLNEPDREKLSSIAKHYFGKSEGMNTATLKLLIEKEYKAITEPEK